MEPQTYDIFPALTLGIHDGLNPCSLSTLLIFCIFISTASRSKKYFMMASTSFILTVLLTKFFIVIGSLDRFFILPFVTEGLQVAWFTIAFCFIVIGIAEFWDWRKCRKRMQPEEFTLKVPSLAVNGFEIGPKAGFFKRLVRSLEIAFISFIIGFFMAILGTLLPQNYYLFIVFYSLFNEAQRFQAIATFMLYCFAYCLPLMAVWFVLVQLGTSAKARSRFANFISMIKITSSAVYLSVGTGLFIMLTTGMMR